MRPLLLSLLLFSFSLFAQETLVCTPDEGPKLFTIAHLKANIYMLTISNSPSEDGIIYQEEMQLVTDYQKPQYVLDTYTGKRSALELEEEMGYYTYLKMNSTGSFEKKAVTLYCELKESL